MIFNSEMTRRLRDLHEACEAGVAVQYEKRPATQGHLSDQPAHIRVTFGVRMFALPIVVAQGVAAQLAENGFTEAAAALEAALQ